MNVARRFFPALSSTGQVVLRRLLARLPLALCSCSVVGAALLVSPIALAQAPTELFLSEYVEGSSNNKAVEIYNGTGAAVDLSAGGYDLQVFFNGSASAGLTISLTGVVATGDVFVVAHASADPAILAEADLTNGAGWFNGDDAVVLRKAGVIIDALGQVGFDPGSEWGSGLTSTADNTLRRKGEICSGDPTPSDPFDPAAEWDGYATNTFDGLGAHSVTCAVIPPADPLVNELVFNHTGNDTFEYVEILGNPSTDYSAFTVLQIEGDGAGQGTIDSADAVGSTDGAGFFLIGPYANVFENGSVTLLLVEGFSGPVGADVDTDDDGSLDTTFWNRLVDSVAIDDGGAGDAHYSPAVLTPSFDGLPFAPGGASRIPDGADTDGAADWLRNDFDGAGLPGFVGTPDQGEALNTPGATNQAVLPPPPPILINELDSDTPGSDAAELVELYDGGAGATPLDGLVVVFFNGNGDLSYAAFDLDGFTTDAAGYFLLGNAGVVPTPDIVFVDNGLQNGADAVALLQGDAADFPNGTAVTSIAAGAIVDAIVYGTGDASDAGLLALLDPGEPQVDENGGGDGPGQSSQRCPNGAGGARKTASYLQAAPTPAAENDCPRPFVVINEVDSDTPGADTAELIELYDGGTGGTPLDGFVVVLFNGSSDTSYSAFDLDGFATDGSGYFLLGNAAVVPTPQIVFANNGLQNGADAVALLHGNAADFPNGTAVTSIDPADLVDAIVYGTSDPDDPGLLVLLDAGQPQVDENAGGNGADVSSQRCPDGSGGERHTDTYRQGVPTPAARNACTFEIWEIQGDGLTSPFVGLPLTTADNVVTALAADGFFIQTPDSRSDADRDTSDGIFVFTGGAPGVAVGDQVDVTGTVSEFFDFTEIGGGPSVAVDSSGNPLPSVVTFDASVPSPDPTTPSCAIEFECYESMRIRVAGGTVSGPNQRFGTDPIAEVHVVAGPIRAFREPGILFPGLPGLPVFDGNPEVFELDPDRLGLPNQIIPAGSHFDAEGVLGFEFGGYELWPTSLTVSPATLPRPVSPRQAGELTVASLNMFRFFDDVDDPPSTNVEGAVRDDAVVSTAEWLRRREKFVRIILDVLDAPDILAVEEVEKIENLDTLAADIAAADPSVVYTAYLMEGNDVGTIDTGFLVRDTVQVDGVAQIGLAETYLNPTSGMLELLHDRPPLELDAHFVGNGADFPLTVIAVHNRSLSGIEDAADGPRVRAKRLAQAQSIAQTVQDLQSADPAIHLVVIGDFNAYEFTDGFVDAVGQIAGDLTAADNLLSGPDLVDPDLTIQTLALPPGERYSFVFGGSAQAIDHALTSSALDPLVRGFEYARGDADAAVDLINDETTPLRSSDHDGQVLFLFADSDGDGVADEADLCAGTMVPEGVPTQGLNPNHFALVDGDRIFDSGGGGAGDVFTLDDTAGCACEQIIDALHLGNGHRKHGCAVGVMRDWVESVSR